MQHFTRAQIRSMAVDFETTPVVDKKHGKPYAKGNEGKQRRNARRAAIARKRAFLN